MPAAGIAVPSVWLITGPPRRDFSPGLTLATTSNPINDWNIACPVCSHCTVADFYRYVVGVDTHAATHSYAIIAAPNRGSGRPDLLPDHARAGLRRARDWVGRRTDGDLGGVLISAEGAGSYGGVHQRRARRCRLSRRRGPPPRRDRGRGKTHALDAVLAARSTPVIALPDLRDRRAREVHTACPQELTGARDQFNADRLRCTARSLRWSVVTIWGVDARRALTSQQIATVAGWRRREDSLAASRLLGPKRSGLPSASSCSTTTLSSNRADITALVDVQAPELLDLPGVATIPAAIVLTVWSHPGRIRGEAAFAQIAGTCPIPASSGNTVRHRLNRGGD